MYFVWRLIVFYFNYYIYRPFTLNVLTASDKVHGSLPENYKTSLKAVEQLFPGG